MSLGHVQVKDRVFTEWTRRYCLLLACVSVDGVLGLERPQPSSSASPESESENLVGILRMLSDQKLLERDIFSLRIPRYRNQTGELRFGSTNQDLHNDNFVRLPLVPTTKSQGDNHHEEWTVPFNNVSSSLPTPTKSTTPAGAIAHIDPFRPYIELPNDFAYKFLDAINASVPDMIGRIFVDCAKRSSMPVLSFELGDDGRVFNVTADDYVTEWKYRDYPMECTVAAVPRGEGRSEDEMLLGQPFLKAFYSVFDWVDESISRK